MSHVLLHINFARVKEKGGSFQYIFKMVNANELRIWVTPVLERDKKWRIAVMEHGPSEWICVCAANKPSAKDTRMQRMETRATFLSKASHHRELLNLGVDTVAKSAS
jgi:predicted SprT family Zn-dependent metalloprotease